jgi:hypothetical protein
VGQKQNSYDSLATYLESDSTLSSASVATDKVDLALDKVSSKMISELASLCAETIVDHPEFQDDYVLAIVDDGSGNREARVYSREEIVQNYETEEEKAAALEALKKEPLVVFSSSVGIPESSDSEAAKELQEKVTKFLTTNEELLNLLDTYGYNPFEQLKL